MISNFVICVVCSFFIELKWNGRWVGTPCAISLLVLEAYLETSIFYKTLKDYTIGRCHWHRLSVSLAGAYNFGIFKRINVINRRSRICCYDSQPASPVSMTAPTRDFRSRFKSRILVDNWKKYPCQFHWQRVAIPKAKKLFVSETRFRFFAIDSRISFLALAIASKKNSKTVSETRAKWSQFGTVSETQGLTFPISTSCLNLHQLV